MSLRRYLQDAIAVLNSVVVACGGGERVENILRLLHEALEAERLGDRQVMKELIERCVMELDELREVYRNSGCLEAHKIDDVITALETVLYGV